jgi:hypothetical protein
MKEQSQTNIPLLIRKTSGHFALFSHLMHVLCMDMVIE